MKVEVLFFGFLKDRAGKSSATIHLAEKSTLKDLLSCVLAEIPTLTGVLSSIAISVNQEYAPSDTELREGDEVALLPPVSGGTDPSHDPITGQSSTKRCGIVRTKIVSDEVTANLKRPSDGAVVAFEGIVRDHTRDRRTLYLEYEAYEEMAVKQMEALSTQALANFEIADARIIHRVGRIEIGETSVLIAVTAEHRAAAFDSCRWLIDTLKRTVAIWKKEYFSDGAVWVDGEPFPPEIPRAGDTN